LAVGHWSGSASEAYGVHQVFALEAIVK